MVFNVFARMKTTGLLEGNLGKKQTTKKVGKFIGLNTVLYL